MPDFTRVKVTRATYEELATKLNGNVDSFENPNRASLEGNFNTLELTRFIGKELELSGYATDAPSFPRSISMVLDGVEDGKLTFKSSAHKSGD
ncbi:hypothetical protein [Cyclobacterium jeungdonense]|uniref:Uncharacterized protein n=1 Tax=Cyclobacterium jeungdonense TaxID=708087 RepID=A0ABT8C565_9BACT|nr:hypothetical protein [Cyclobacterium jeungdonense]MDN3687247.1 hypothetical protein [Cyclobacterium jeungdonense]